ncbi:hypothetical protein ONZ45_g8831 [Pleurotus djamor]|nr:hypothetical protein ONZ45_g8831 [Pleurotus djamor]
MKFSFALLVSAVLAAQAIALPTVDVEERADADLATSPPHDHFYTTNAVEWNNAANLLGYTREGVTGKVFPGKASGTIPLYRLWSLGAGDHFYTTNNQEAENAKGLGYVREGIAGWVFPSAVCGSIPLYRTYSPSGTDHFHTTDFNEKNNAVRRLGYTDEGVAGYVLLCGCLFAFTSTTFAALYAFPNCVNGPLKSNGICDTSKTPKQRAQALASVLTVEELINRTGNINPDIPRLGLSSYNFWSEALHGLATSPGVSFAPSGNFSFATSFPLPINLGATFDDLLIKSVATVISTEAQAFNNHGFSGLDYFTPNINPFKDPRWGRGMETPGEDPFRISRYVLNLVDGIQGGIDPLRFKVAADCKHFAAYDLELWQGFGRFSFNALVTTQDLSEYYLPPFRACVRDAKAASVMCSYNEINGTPSCANSFLLKDILRDWWGFDEDRWVTADCDAVDNIRRSRGDCFESWDGCWVREKPHGLC